MTRQIMCVKLNQTLEGLNSPPFPGPLGLNIFNHVSKQAWGMWVAHQTMLINEYRLNLLDPKSRDFLYEEMQNYFFGEGSKAPSGFVPENPKVD